MIIRSPEPEVKILVDRDPIKTSFEEWARPGHFSRTIAKGPDTTTWIWNLHADAHDFDSHTSDLEEISRKVFSAHFGQLSIIFLWLSGMYFHGARFSNYEAWLSDPTHIGPSAQVVWPIVGQEILNGDVGGGFRGIQITSGFFQIWRASGITSELQLYCTAIGALIFAALMLFAGWFHYHKAAPKLTWFQDVESMLNHHLAGLLGLGSLSWAGHQIHVSLPINQFLNAGVDPKEIPLPHEFILNRDLLAQLYPSFAEGATPFFTLNWSKYAEFLTFRGGLDPVTGGLWLTDIAHHHLAIAILFLIAGHMYRTNWGIGHGLKDILEAHKGPFTGQGHKGLYEILTTSWHAQLSLNLAMLGSLTIVVAHHMYSMPPYPYLATDYGTQLSLFTHHMWIGGFLIVGAAAHAAIFMVRDYDPTTRYNDLLDRVLRHRDAIISHLNWACIFLGFHSFGLYIHNDTMSALGRPQDMFSDTAIQLQPVFAQWIQNTHALAPGATAPGAITSTSLTWGGGDLVAVGGKVALLPIPLGTADFLWWYTIGLRTNEDLYTGALFLLFLSAISLTAGWLHLQPKWKPSVSWFKNAESRLNHHLSGLFGVSSLAWTGHLVHVAIPGSRGEYIRWNNFLDVLPHPQGLGPLFTGQWNLYAQNPDSSSHLFGTSQGAGTAILTLLGGFHPQTQSLWLTDIAHHHLAIAFIFLVAGHMYRTNFGIGHSMKDLLEAHIPPGGRLGRGHKGLYDTINNSIHFQLGLALASLGVITSLVAQHMYSLPAYAFIAQDFTTQAALYTHHQYIAGFIMTGAFAHGAIFFIRDYNPEQNEDNVLARMLDHKEAIISHLSWASLFLGFHTLGLYVHNDVMLAFGTPEKQILIEPIFAQWIQSAHGKTSYGFDVLLSSTTGPAFNAGRSIWLPGWLNAVNENSYIFTYAAFLIASTSGKFG
ncbi:Photosystem I PsaA/PsaB [Dillenia turbinata]|uniref:Photosystem I PsaA/PsaB n=1 Tax=Dillenia turbinata TaxID=194707 RepID=A0AAN8Z234_9MAGN